MGCAASTQSPNAERHSSNNDTNNSNVKTDTNPNVKLVTELPKVKENSSEKHVSVMKEPEKKKKKEKKIKRTSSNSSSSSSSSSSSEENKTLSKENSNSHASVSIPIVTSISETNLNDQNDVDHFEEEKEQIEHTLSGTHEAEMKDKLLLENVASEEACEESCYSDNKDVECTLVTEYKSSDSFTEEVSENPIQTSFINDANDESEKIACQNTEDALLSDIAPEEESNEQEASENNIEISNEND